MILLFFLRMTDSQTYREQYEQTKRITDYLNTIQRYLEQGVNISRVKRMTHFEVEKNVLVTLLF